MYVNVGYLREVGLMLCCVRIELIMEPRSIDCLFHVRLQPQTVEGNSCYSGDDRGSSSSTDSEDQWLKVACWFLFISETYRISTREKLVHLLLFVGFRVKYDDWTLAAHRSFSRSYEVGRRRREPKVVWVARWGKIVHLIIPKNTRRGWSHRSSKTK